MNITSAEYFKHYDGLKNIRAIADGQELWIPIDPNNRHYAEIKKQVDAGTLTIEDAD